MNLLNALLLSALPKNPFNYMQPLLSEPLPIHATTASSIKSESATAIISKALQFLLGTAKR